MNSTAKKILIVDDEEDIIDLLSYNLKKEDFDVYCASSGTECLSIVKKHRPDIIILDVMMPGMNGLEVCDKLKNNFKTKDIPIIMLTAKSGENDIINGLNTGADNYVIKPFSLKVLFAKINSLLRRTDTFNDQIICLDELKIDIDQREVFVRDKLIKLTFSRFEILLLFAKNPGTVFSRKKIVREVKGDDYPVTERAIDVHIVEMRKLLLDYGSCIKTVRGIGYKFVVEGSN